MPPKHEVESSNLPSRTIHFEALAGTAQKEGFSSEQKFNPGIEPSGCANEFLDLLSEFFDFLRLVDQRE